MANISQLCIFKKAIDVIGERELVDRAIEEMAELTVAINHHRRKRCSVKAVQEEIADVQIALRTIAKIYGQGEVMDIYYQKIERFHGEINDRRRRRK